METWSRDLNNAANATAAKRTNAFHFTFASVPDGCRTDDGPDGVTLPGVPPILPSTYSGMMHTAALLR